MLPLQCSQTDSAACFGWQVLNRLSAGCRVGEAPAAVKVLRVCERVTISPCWYLSGSRCRCSNLLGTGRRCAVLPLPLQEVLQRRLGCVFGSSKERNRKGTRLVVIDFVVAGQLPAFRNRERMSSLAVDYLHDPSQL